MEPESLTKSKTPASPSGEAGAAGLGVTPADIKEVRIDLSPLGVHGPYGIKFMLPEILRRFNVVWAPVYYEMDGKVEEVDEAFKEFYEDLKKRMPAASPVDAAKRFAAKIKVDGVIVFETACEKMILVFCYTRWAQ
jgi:hypothetical protein